MSASSTGPGTDDLQFDRATDPEAASPGNPVCARCNAPIRMFYYHVNGETTCSTCKQSMGGSAGKSKAGMPKALLYGLGAAIAGAVIYYAVMEYLELEIGYVAILIGFMVGYAIRNALAGRGSRRFQFLAAGLTYFAVALAYAPFAIRGMLDPDATEISADSLAGEGLQPLAALNGADDVIASADADDAVSGSTAASDADPVDSEAIDTTIVAPEQLGAGGVAIATGAALFFIFALPVIVILGSMPGGLISALIIAIGMRQAWSMTGGEELAITGPFKIGSEPPPAPV